MMVDRLPWLACWCVTAVLGTIAANSLAQDAELDKAAARPVGLTSRQAPATAELVNASLGIIPNPRRVEKRTGSFALHERTPILLPAAAGENERFAVRELVESLRETCNLTLLVAEPAEPIQAPAIRLGRPSRDQEIAAAMNRLGLALSDEMKKEGYLLAIEPDGIWIAAESDVGLLYGTMSLRQMVIARSSSERPDTVLLPAVRITDWPAMALRGIHDEVSYGQMSTMDNFKDYIRFCAQYKMNVYMIYLEDTFRFSKYPTIGLGRGAMTAEQVRELQDFAKPFHVDIIPIWETLGNQGALLMLDEIRPLAEFPGAHSFAVGPETNRFLEDCLEDLTQAFDSKYFHAGLDESWDLGFGKTEARVNQEGRGAVHADHYRTVHEMLRRRGRTMMMYGDIVLTRPEILDMIPKDIIIMDWIYEPLDHYPTVDTLAKAGFPLMVLPGMNNWDRIFPRMSAAMINIRNFTLDCHRNGGLGSIVSTWGDNGSKNFRELLWAGYAYGAEVTWSPEFVDVNSFYNRFFTLWNGPGTAGRFQAIYALLEKWPWWYPLLDYFRHPLLPRKDEKPLEEIDLIRVYEDAVVAEQLANELESVVLRRRGDLDYLRYCARMHQNYVLGQWLARDLLALDPSKLTERDRERAIAEFLERIDQVRGQMSDLKDHFRELWLRTNIEANLHYCLGDYDQMLHAWDQIRAQLAAGDFALDPRPASEWIYSPHAFDKDAKVQHVFFRRTVDVPEGGATLNLQFMGDTHIRIFVNGEFVAEQFERRNLSAPVNPRLVQLHDVTAKLRPGRNVIAVEARNYGTENEDLEPGGPHRSAGFHFYGELTTPSGQITPLFSDAFWKTFTREVKGWNEVDFKDADWPAAKGDPKPTVWITRPDFKAGVRGFSDVR